MKKLLKSKLAQVSAFGAAVVSSSSAFAVDHTETISAAITDGTTNYTAVITGVITVAAIGFCVGYIIRQFNR